MIYKTRSRKQNWTGETIGIMVLDCEYPYIPGNVANATTFPFPVRYIVVEGADNHRLIFDRDPTLLEPFIVAARKLEAEGVKAITGACGFMALFQKEIAAAVNVPVFMSSLLQVPFIYNITGKRVGVISADSGNLTDEHLVKSGIALETPLAIGGMEKCEPFRQAIFFPDGTLDDDAVRDGVLGVATDLQRRHPDLGAILLECSDLPPYAHDVQQATGLPVFDFITMINYVHASFVRTRYSGWV
ncbi:aspartate/glutamate racemase family protein [Mesorhizobium sp.]|uniref:aspartate/glutamate racemase family protein n=1 Tax=Mesorhizobium sp. TaxID=1871066 RepID=UPI0025F0EC31|nr:aspartate/glutamate racemase family protein [Mesorhizobium sp.]